MSRAKCPRCGSVFRVPGPGRHACPGCGAVYRIAPPEPAAGRKAPGAERPPRSRAAPPEPGSEERTGRPAPIAALVREGILCAAGIGAIVAGVVIFLAGPFDRPERTKAREKRDALARRLEPARQELGALEARAEENRTRAPAESRRAEEARRKATRLRSDKVVLDRLDAELEKLRSELEKETDPPGESSSRAGGLAGAEKGVVVIRTRNIFSASPDGRHAASGTHTCTVKARKAIRKLPFPSPTHAFSRDGASLYLYDPIRGSLYLLQDRERNAAEL